MCDSCPCGYSFCFLCGKRWHTCQCSPDWGRDHRLPVRFQEKGVAPAALPPLNGFLPPLQDEELQRLHDEAHRRALEVDRRHELDRELGRLQNRGPRPLQDRLIRPPRGDLLQPGTDYPDLYDVADIPPTEHIWAPGSINFSWVMAGLEIRAPPPTEGPAPDGYPQVRRPRVFFGGVEIPQHAPTPAPNGHPTNLDQQNPGGEAN
jgi:hypothetical protein